MAKRGRSTHRRSETTAKRWLVSEPSIDELRVARERLGSVEFHQARVIYDRTRSAELEAQRRALWSETELPFDDNDSKDRGVG